MNTEYRYGWSSNLDFNNKWQPCLQLGGIRFFLQVWFKDKEKCDKFIREQIISQEMIKDDLPD